MDGHVNMHGFDCRTLVGSRRINQTCSICELVPEILFRLKNVVACCFRFLVPSTFHVCETIPCVLSSFAAHVKCGLTPKAFTEA